VNHQNDLEDMHYPNEANACVNWLDMVLSMCP
jgi:hypothetical protein